MFLIILIILIVVCCWSIYRYGLGPAARPGRMQKAVRDTLSQGSGDTPVPPWGTGATVHQKDALEDDDPPLYWVLFHLADGGYKNLTVPEQIYRQLEIGQSAFLEADRTGDALLRFGDLWDDDLLEAQELEAESPQAPAPDEPDLSQPPPDGCWPLAHTTGLPLPDLTVEQLLALWRLPEPVACLPKVERLAAQVLADALSELAAFDSLPRTGTAGEYTRWRRKELHLRLALQEQAPPLENSIAGELTIRSLKSAARAHAHQ